jgi:hypothetical protein
MRQITFPSLLQFWKDPGRTFCQKTFRQKDILPKRHFAKKTFRQKDILSERHFIIKYFVTDSCPKDISQKTFDRKDIL